MPPKKAPAAKKDPTASSSIGENRGSIQDIRGPVNTCEFKVKIEL